ncbi:MAG: hypothetical protein A2202_03740 [Bdellovibrionales bacterium RIFOXYA1_FULL_36_14]|nr:MAG: hypothetical protein A2202_03740 [Bdellovibrionales bacterium RIFOXYA1_FULL_36_14]
MIKVIILICIFLPANLFAQGFEIYKKGDGAKYHMKMQDNPDSEISIYFADVKKESISVEFFIYAQNTLIPVKLYQQFLLAKNTDGSLMIKESYIQGPDEKYPQRMNPESFTNSNGIELNDFFFSDEKQLKASLIGKEELLMAAGKARTHHYRKVHNGQHIDYWISHDSKPFGLIKMISKNEKVAEQNYTVELLAILKNVTATINPKNAKPLDQNGKKILNGVPTFK